MSSRIIPSNTATASLRRVPFLLVDATDLVTPEDISVTGVKVSLSVDGGTPANSTNDIVKVDGATGRYYLELTQTEVNQTAGALIEGRLAPSGCAATRWLAQVGQSTVLDSTVTVGSVSANAITATAIQDGAITAAKIATGAIDADAIAADAVTEIQSGLATAAALATVDTVVDTIQAKTDSLTFTVAGVVDANIQRINDVTITGNGSGTPFGV